MAIAGARRVGFHPAADPNVIPFIDVLLVLLIIFMVTAPKPTTDLRVDLPRPGPTLPPAIPPTVVTIQAEGAGYRVLVGAEEVAPADLARETLRHILAANPALEAEDAHADARVFVRADLDVAYQNVVTVVETLQGARFERVAIVAQNADDS
jgi:biopolymer transport protein ExbD